MPVAYLKLASESTMPYYAITELWRTFQSCRLVKAGFWRVVKPTVPTKTFSLFSNDILHYKYFLMCCSTLLLAAIIR